jgi:hypothetical protein
MLYVFLTSPGCAIHTAHLILFYLITLVRLDLLQWPLGLRLKISSADRTWDHGFESHSRNGCMSASFLCLSYPVQVADLRRAHALPRESYQLSVRFTDFKLILK